MRASLMVLRGAGVLSALSALVFAAHSQAVPNASVPNTLAPHILGSVASASPLPNGIRMTASGGGVEEITALRDGVLRVRISATATLPEDASWAVLPEARKSSVAVTQDESAAAVGFRTKSLRVELDRATLCLTVRDSDGNILQQDAAPVVWEGWAFRIRKIMPADEHYYGLGDKIGPTDRRNRAFTMWNTDAYRFQESTDPLYKSIPFFMTFRAGKAVGRFPRQYLAFELRLRQGLGDELFLWRIWRAYRLLHLFRPPRRAKCCRITLGSPVRRRFRPAGCWDFSSRATRTRRNRG